MTDDDVVESFARLMDDLPRPVLFYCRTGTRCSVLWAQAAVARLGVARTLEIVTEAGYDLEPLREQLVEREASALADVASAAAGDQDRSALSLAG